MEKKIIILIFSLLAFCVTGFIVWRVFLNQEKWTGFYFPNVGEVAKITGINTGMNIDKYQSDVNEFDSLKGCQDWAKAVRSLLLKTRKEASSDIFLCNPGCKKEDNGNVTCTKNRGVFSTFE